VPILDERVLSLIRDLPDEKGPQVFLERIAAEQPRAHQLLMRNRGLLSDTLALAAWSPLLSTTLEQNPDYISWLSRERMDDRVRSRDELKESLARFALTHSSLAPQAILARFRRRELLRTYLHDIRETHALVETTEELSNVADAVLEYALNLARQDLDNKYGVPRTTDERGREAIAEFTIVALGKLGSFELNYASDIDLMFLYSAEGTTSGKGERGEVTNREYFVKLAETVAKLVGQPGGEGAAYRVDLRLRPHGRDGALACSLEEALKYYRSKAQAWELQAMIRSRAAAGSAQLFQRFAAGVKDNVFRPDVSVGDALASVRLAKQKIDRQRERDTGGFNVKLHRGGIREIEFIAQALQLAHGGRDDWLKAPHTLISLGRLADRDLIFESERTELSEAYLFLRKLEHRLQMEQGLQTHAVPLQADHRALVSRRMDFDEMAQFDAALEAHITNVRSAFDRVFEETHGMEPAPEPGAVKNAQPMAPERSLARTAAAALLPHLVPADSERTVDSIADLLLDLSNDSLNANRALVSIARIASSLDKLSNDVEMTEENLAAMVRLSGSSEFFSEIVASNPTLVTTLPSSATHARRDFRSALRSAIDPERTFAAELSAFRRQWARLLLEVGIKDAAGDISDYEANRLQTELATASLNVAYLIARRELVRRFGNLSGGPRIAVLGVGRLGTGGVDYGSDLDVILAYDSLVPSPIASLTCDEAYARLAELFVTALTSVTREGYLYRVDLRLRPNGQSGPLVVSSDSFIEYAKQGTAVWEWLAYVKLRAIAGDIELGKMVETHARHAIHENARRIPVEELKVETRRVRDRLEMEKGQRVRQGELDIKYAAGGMLDVYFAVRFLQLRDDISDEGEERSTQTTLERLEANGSLEQDDYSALAEGYSLLRTVDHQLRLLVGKSGKVPVSDHAIARDIAGKLNFSSSGDLHATLQLRMREIRAAYDRITQ
jgi:[glutamine synthetase] adenylyltransferase / [glutamine synthetase]-adenylyl-L-tyrosine phosphorylase